MFFISLILGGILSFILLLYLFLIRNYDYWESRGVACRKQKFIYGNIKERVYRQISFHEFVQKFYEEMKGKAYAGLYEGTRPVLFIIDPEVIKLVLVKHFDHFTDRFFVKFKAEDYLSKIMIALQGAEWKRARVACTPAFSSGRLKAMVPLIDACAQQMINHLNGITKDKGETVLDIKCLLINYTLDTIASTSFGINLNSFCDNESEFTKKALQFQDISVFRRFIILLCIMYEVPTWITSCIPVSFFNYETIKFFAKTLIDTRNYRIQNNVRRNDLLQLLLDAQAAPVELLGEIDEEINNEKRETIDEATAIAQSVFFFMAGFETSSTHLSMVFYELAKNKDIQEKTRRDILEHWDDNGPLTYETISSMTYLDMVMTETLRLYPPVPRLERIVTKPIDLPGLKLDVGMKVVIPTIGLHHDPEYYPDPMSFKPERFSQEEKMKRHPYVFLAFGAGPRNCIGLRFANISSKICTAHVLKHFEIDICDKTPIPFVYDRQAFLLKAKDNIYLKLKRING